MNKMTHKENAMSIENIQRGIIGFVLFTGLACNMSRAPAEQNQPVQQLPESSPPPVSQEAEAIQETEPTLAPLEPTPAAIPSHPLGIRQGLSLLNSYRLRLHNIHNGPSSQDHNESTTTIEYNKEGDQYHSRGETISSSSDEPEVVTEISEQYRIGEKTCDLSSSDDSAEVSAEVEVTSPAEQAMADGLLLLFDGVVFAENPVLVGSETINGIPTNHFTFDVTGLSSITGAEVTQSHGEYWIAQEGQYLVKYQAVLEARSASPADTEAEVMYMEVEIELLEADVPISISMPSQCQ
jgi:hypothetical protein